MVPSFANSNKPIFPDFFASVKEPPSYPKSSDSKSSPGIAAQFTLIKGLLFLLLLEYISSATTSFPVPDSPIINTVTSVGAIVLISSIFSF